MAIMKELRRVWEMLTIAVSQLALAPILLNREAFTQDGYNAGLITDIYLDFEGKTGHIVVARGYHIPMNDITNMGSEIIISRSRGEFTTQSEAAT